MIESAFCTYSTKLAEVGTVASQNMFISDAGSTPYFRPAPKPTTDGIFRLHHPSLASFTVQTEAAGSIRS